MTKFPQFLKEGYQQFKSGSFKTDQERYETLAREGQNPEVMMIACCDSRSAPETIFCARPGEMFVVRNVANLVQPNQVGETRDSISAALEFAVLGLKVKHIVVMGHGNCGGVNAALDHGASSLSEDNLVGGWIKLLQADAEEVRSRQDMTGAEKQNALEKISIRNSLQNLRTYPFISAAETDGILTLHGTWFDISKAELWIMDSATGDFRKMEA